MGKYILQGLRILWITLVSIFVLVFTLFILLQDPKVQTKVSSAVVEKVLSGIDGEVTFEKIHFKPFNTIIIKNLSVRDQHPTQPYPEVKKDLQGHLHLQDTLVHCEYLIVRFSIMGLLNSKGKSIDIEKADIKNGFFNLVVEDGRTSLERIFGMYKDRMLSYQPKNEELVITVENVELDNMAFSLHNYKRRVPRRYPTGAVSWTDLHCKNIHARGKNLKIEKGVISGELLSCRFEESCGLAIDNVRAKFNIREGYVDIQDIQVVDRYTDLRLPYFRMIYDGAEAFRDYIGKVRMSAQLSNSEIDTRTLDYFADITSKEGMKVRLNGIFDGTVREFSLKNMKVETPDGKLSAIVDGNVFGIPIMQRTRFDLNIKNLTSDNTALEQILRVFGRQKIELPTFHIRQFNTKLEGQVNDFDIMAQVESNVGRLNLDGKISELIDKRKDTRIALNLSSDKLRLDKILQNNTFGDLTLQAAINARLDREDPLAADVEIDSIYVENLHLLGYDYGPIDIRGDIHDKNYNGSIVIDDENLKFFFNGLATLIPKNKEDILYQFDAGLEYIDLQALGFMKNRKARVKMDLFSDLAINSDRQILGDLLVDNILLENEEDLYRIGDLKADFFTENHLHNISLDADFIEGDFEGSRSLLHLLGKNINQLLQRQDDKWDSSEYSLYMKSKDMEPLLDFLTPGLYIKPGMILDFKIDSLGTLDGNIVADDISINDNKIENIRFELDNQKGNIGGKLSCNQVELGQFAVKDIDLGLWADLSQKDYSVAGLNASQFSAGNKIWKIAPSKVELRGKKGIHIQNFSLSHKSEGIFIDGKIASTALNDTLSVSMNNFDLGLLSGFLGNNFPRFGGNISGEALLGRKNGKYGVEADIVCEDSHFNKKDLGTLLISSEWDADLKRYSILVDNSYNSAPTFELGASYSPYSDNFFASGDFKNFDISLASYFVKDIFNQMEGGLNGLVTVEGNFKNLKNIEIDSHDLYIRDATLGIEYTKVAYNISTDLELNNEGVFFQNVQIRDRFGATGKAEGGILWNDFKQPSIDLQIQVNKLEALNIKEKDLSSYVFYGNMFGTGEVNITGPFNSILLDVKASTSGVNSDFNLTLKNLSQGKTTSSILDFKRLEPQNVKQTGHKKQVKPKKPNNDLSIKLDLEVTPDIMAHIDIDKFNGSRISAQGSGNILIDIRPSKELFKINGHYNIADGNVRFVVFGLTAKDFKVSSGSSVTFGGDAMETMLNIDAVYKTKASLSAIIADSTAVNKRRAVECGIRVTDRLRDPKIAFSIDVPDLEPSYKTQVESAFSTEDKIQKQFLALLISGTFLPDEQSGIADNTAVLFSNVSELMTTQLNNIFMKLNIPLDLGFNYQTTSTGANLFDVAISTQLFNNRVLVNGVIGNKQRNGGTNNEVVGDIDIEVKINKSGSLRVNAFSHSSDQYSNYLDNLQRTGVGLSWQQEFNNFANYVKQIFSKKENRALLEEQEINQEKKAGTKRITIQ